MGEGTTLYSSNFFYVDAFVEFCIMGYANLLSLRITQLLVNVVFLLHKLGIDLRRSEELNQNY